MPGRRSGLPRSAHAATGRDRWLLSYADFITLLLALFVVLYASARVEVGEGPSAFEGIRAAFFFEGDAPAPVASPEPIETEAPARPAVIEPASIEQLASKLAEELASQRRMLGESTGATLYRNERGLVIALASTEFFPTGGVEIPEERREVLAAIAPVLGSQALPLHFEGHTDASPIQSDLYPSNWELSTARAAAVARFFIEEHGIDPRRVATTGYAEFRPITPNEDAARRARNRRVEIVVLEAGELVPRDPESEAAAARQELDRLLEALPPIAERADETLRPPQPGPPPPDAPLP